MPQSLLFLGVLEYSEELLEILKAGEKLDAGGEREVEIRACSIWAVEVRERERAGVFICTLGKERYNSSS